MPSGDRARYGRLVEEALAKKYDIARSGNHSKIADGRDPQGRPTEIKGAVYRRAPKPGGGRYPGYFQIRGAGHEGLLETGRGSYVFGVWDRDRGRCLASRRVPASRVDRLLARAGHAQHRSGDGLASIRWDRVIDPSSLE